MSDLSLITVPFSHTSVINVISCAREEGRAPFFGSIADNGRLFTNLRLANRSLKINFIFLTNWLQRITQTPHSLARCCRGELRRQRLRLSVGNHPCLGPQPSPQLILLGLFFFPILFPYLIHPLLMCILIGNSFLLVWPQYFTLVLNNLDICFNH